MNEVKMKEEWKGKRRNKKMLQFSKGEIIKKRMKRRILNCDGE